MSGKSTGRRAQPIDLVTVEYMAANGAELKEIAAAVGVEYQAFHYRRYNDPEVSGAYERGRSLHAGVAEPKEGPAEAVKLVSAEAEAAARKAERVNLLASQGEADILAVRGALSAAGAEGLCMRELREITGLDYSRINLAIERMFMEISEETKGLVGFYRLKNRA